MCGVFTQQDPIGLAGGLNLYGFASGDPVNFSDPFGLCRDDDGHCRALVRLLQQQQGAEFQAAASRYDAIRNGRVRFVPGDDPNLDSRGLNRDGDPATWVGGTTSGEDAWINADFNRGDQLVTAVHESYHLPQGGALSEFEPTQARSIRSAERRAYRQLSHDMRADAPRTARRLGYRARKPVTEPGPENDQ